MEALRLAAVTAPNLSDKREWNREVIFASQTMLSERRFFIAENLRFSGNKDCGLTARLWHWQAEKYFLPRTRRGKK